MKTIKTLLIPLSIFGFALVIDVPTGHAQSKPTCSVREGVEFHRQRNYGKAFECWDQHARLGSSAAQFNIARMYILGEGVPRNKVEAYKWLTIADRSGRPEARKALTKVREGMTPEQLEDARKRVQRFYNSR
ncbi:MAG: tetratricopeptide repeat protein [Alphaproteobacteria bacterium]